ncbi:MAG: penicillin-binding protein 2 [Caldiserica bacterium]|nr:penicillin-binding protein 2 [Caldisericota bacterium]
MRGEIAIKRATVVFVLLGLGALAVVARLFQVQVAEHARWARLAREIQEEVVTLPAQRGTIYDRNGLPLAYDVPAYDIALDNYHMTKPELLVDLLVEVLGLPPKKASALVYREGYFTWVMRRVDRAVGDELRRRADALGIRGLLFFNSWTRAYPQGLYALDLVGIVGVDGQGLEALEYAFNRELEGEEKVLRLVRGRDGLVYEYWVEEQGRKGKDLHLTIDARVQRICAEMLDRGVEQFRAIRGFAVVLDPRTGEILALAQSPRAGLEDPDPSLLHSWAVTDPIEPGSTLKALVGTAALDLGIVDPFEEFNANSPIYVDGQPIRNAEGKSYGEVYFWVGITKSINTVLVQVALRLGVERAWEYLRRFGVGESTGVELPGEALGTIRPPGEWTRVDLATAAFGQGVSVTGLQLARAFCAIAADGLLPELHILLGERGTPRRVASAQACATMREMLRLAVKWGTGRGADLPDFEVAGKSGTAQKPREDGMGYYDDRVWGAMAAFFPWYAPEYVVLVVYDEPSIWPNWGGSTAGPTVRWIIEEMRRQGLIAPYPQRETRIEQRLREMKKRGPW